MPTPRVSPAISDEVITSSNLSSFIELARYTSKETSTVAAIKFTPSVTAVIAIYADEGFLNQWYLDDGSISSGVKVGPVGLGGVAFDRSARYVALGAGAQWERHKLEDEYLGCRVWDIHNNKLIAWPWQWQKSDEELGLVGRSLAASIALTPGAEWLAIALASAVPEMRDFKDIATVEVFGSRIGDAVVDFSLMPEERDYDVIALDSKAELLAAANALGQVVVFEFRPPRYPEHPIAVVEPLGKLGAKPLALAFSEDRRWLARVRGTELAVWDLQSAAFEGQLAQSVGTDVGDTASLDFNPSGRLLAVGTINGWQMWDMIGKQKLIENNDAPVYAVAFSSDGRLFAYGDANGVIHVWGVRK
jgi:hypothetical protein